MTRNNRYCSVCPCTLPAGAAQLTEAVRRGSVSLGRGPAAAIRLNVKHNNVRALRVTPAFYKHVLSVFYRVSVLLSEVFNASCTFH